MSDQLRIDGEDPMRRSDKAEIEQLRKEVRELKSKLVMLYFYYRVKSDLLDDMRKKVGGKSDT
jgi:hypothetical protein